MMNNRFQVVVGNVESSSSGDAVITALQGQRDRYLKLAREKEQEVIILQAKLERAQEDHASMKVSSLTLYSI